MTTQKRILLADDDISFVTLYRKIFEKASFTVLEAHDGEEAIRIGLEEKPDALIIDMGMPQKSGLEVVSRMRTDSWGATVPIIILTGKDATDDDLSKITALEPTYYVIKGNESGESLVAKLKEVTNS